MTTTGTRTFDCPWCGAISPVPGNHLGEHFACPECKKGTKLTEKNTSTRAPTEAPPDAPHLSGDRTFDCPWCGAIASVPSSHLGEGFRCPECAKGTKLTSTNTRRALITAPPPDAPHPVEATPGGAKALLVVAVLVMAGGGAWYFLAGPGAAKEAEPKTVTVGPIPGRSGPPWKPTAASDAGPAAEPSPIPTSERPAPTDSATGPASDAPILDPGDKAALSKAAAEARVLLAEQQLALANKALEDWRQAHPGALEAGETARALGESTAEIERRLADKALIPDPAKATPEQVRAADAAVRTFLEASPLRAAAAASVLEAMRSDHGGREVAGVADWRELHVTGDGFRRSAAALVGGLEALASTVPADLVKAAADAAEEARSARLAFGPEPTATPTK